MTRFRPVLALALVWGVGATSPSWAAPVATLDLAARSLAADPSAPVPAAGVVYVFTRRGLKSGDLERLGRFGLRYLGVAGQHVYAWQVTGDDGVEISAALAAHPAVLGTAPAEPQDKLRSDVLEHLGTGGPEAALPAPLALTLWPGTPAGAARALVGLAGETMRWPRADAEPVRLEHSVYLDKSASTMQTLAKLMASPYVAAIGFDLPRVSFNEQSRQQSNSNIVFDMPYGLDGAGVVVGHWDGGEVDENHPDLAGRVENLDSAAVSRHATHTAGTILGSGFGDPDARGHAPAATMVARTFNGNAPAERRATKHSHYHEHDNHSWGVDPDRVSNFGTYNQVGYEFDVDGRDLFLLAIKAAGNEGRESEVIVDNTGFDSLSPDSTSKNALVVGATNDRGRLAIFSSRGPTEDGRIKPDICAVGVNVRSTVPGGGYGSSQGTSMSTPGVSGMLALLSQLHTRSFGMRWAPDVARGIMIHTAQDVWNRGPDFRYGWGLADAQAAADVILREADAPGRHLVRDAVREDEVREWTMEVPESEDELKVTLTWLDAFANASAQRLLLHDLDLELIDPNGDVHLPWTLDAANPLEDAVRDAPNRLDNVEQVLVDDPVAGAWTVRVRAVSITDPQLDVQGFVVVTDHPVERFSFRYQAEFATSNDRSIPDNDEAGRTVRFDLPDLGNIVALRVHAEIEHDARGDLRILLEGPDGTRVTLETEDGSERRDLYAIFPDSRSYDDDVTTFYGQSTFGTWTVFVVDTGVGRVGAIRDLALEVDTDGQVNEPPTAVATADDPIISFETGTLWGAGSRDPEGRALTYAWAQVDGPEVTLAGAETATATFEAPEVTQDTLLAFTLSVDDGRGGTDSATVALTVVPPNQPPIADAGDDQQVVAAQSFIIDASASQDPDGDYISFVWRQVSGPEVGFTQTDDPQVLVTAPSIVTEPLVFELTADDGRDQSTDTTTITIVAPPPQALEEADGCGCTTGHPTNGGPAWGGLALLLLIGLRRRR